MGTEEALRPTTSDPHAPRQTQHSRNSLRHTSALLAAAAFLRRLALRTHLEGVNRDPPGRPGCKLAQEPRPYDYTRAVRGSHGTAAIVS